MHKITLIAALVLALPLIAQGYEYRDRFGNLVYTGERSGNQTVYRDRFGNKFETKTHEPGRNVYRDRYGNEVGEDDEE